MSAYAEFFLGSRSNIFQIELFELSHPDFTQTYRVARNPPDQDAVTVDLSPSELDIEFIYYPAKVKQKGSRGDLDFGIEVNLGDVGEIIPSEIDAVAEAGGFLTKPALRYWAFRSDDLAEPIFGPITLEVPQFAINATGASFEARAPQLNANKTGERISLDRFPMQRGLI